MATSKKAMAIAEKLASEFALRLPSLAQTVSADSDLSPLLRLGAGTIGATGAMIKVRPQSWAGAKDVLGLDAQIYAPSVIQVVIEANPAGGAGADVNTPATLHQIWSTVASMGARVELYVSANGNAPGAEDIIAGNLVSSWDCDVKFGLIGNQ